MVSPEMLRRAPVSLLARMSETSSIGRASTEIANPPATIARNTAARNPAGRLIRPAGAGRQGRKVFRGTSIRGILPDS